MKWTPARYAAVLLALVLFLVVFIWSTLSEPADAANPCEGTQQVTSHEWDVIQPGMSRSDVRRVLDGDGRLGPDKNVREYKVCGRGLKKLKAIIWYRDGGRVLDGGFWIQVS